MKKLLVLFAILFATISSSFAYDNSVQVEIVGDDSPRTQEVYANIYATTEICFNCEWYAQQPEWSNDIDGMCTISHVGGSIIDQFTLYKFDFYADNYYHLFYQTDRYDMVKIELYAGLGLNGGAYLWW